MRQTTALIYSKADCPYCVRAKTLLNAKGIMFTETVIGRDVLREDFMEMFPDQKSVPLIFIDGNRIGGYTELVEHFNNGAQLLTE